ncbi:MAG: hypothetical protein CFE21_02480 [Bacteroidetes bacterium B1(2017)]|nr:MAG: hypothetical protein CFE21_02480 [Bacteroidetes bacterium B1(2017)]
MRKFSSYIALLLTLILGVSLVPYNAIHQHHEEEHLASLLTPELNSHTCEFDTQNCQGEFTHTCDHGHHLSKKSANCFTCQFHFIKGYTNFETTLSTSDELVSFLQVSKQIDLQSRSLLFVGNKGPPKG